MDGIPEQAHRGQTRLSGEPYITHPLAVAGALAVLDVIEDEKLCARAALLGEKTRARFAALASRFDCIAEVRGLGAMSAVEFCHAADPRRPAPEIMNALKAEAAKRGLLLLGCGSYGNVLRLMLPLTLSDAVLDEGMAILEEALVEAVAAASR